MSCSKGGKPGYKWGKAGKCYTYTKGSASGAANARAKAKKQGAAIHAAEGKSTVIDKLKSFFVERVGEVVQEGLEKKTDIQTLLFDKEKFTVAEAKKWARTHGFKSSSVRVPKEGTQIRLQQRPVKDFVAGSK